MARLIGIAIAHTGTRAQNEARVTRIGSLLTGNWDSGWTFAGATLPYGVLVFQAVPLGVTPPRSFGDFSAGSVIYAGDQPSHDRHLANWAWSRAMLWGCDALAIVTDASSFTVSDFETQLVKVAGPKVLVSPVWGWIVQMNVLTALGQLREDLGSLTAAISELRQRIAAAGLTSE